jgi:aldehyde:ferredoxin oxidoreductase
LVSSLKGYTGSILRINLTSNKIAIQKLTKSFVRTYLGGRGFASRILYDEIKREIDPLDPENLLMFATGPLNGTAWPQTGRYALNWNLGRNKFRWSLGF